MKKSIIKKGEGEYKYCARCKKRYRRKKSIWYRFYDPYDFCPKCKESYNKWWDSSHKNSEEGK